MSIVLNRIIAIELKIYFPKIQLIIKYNMNQTLHFSHAKLNSLYFNVHLIGEMVLQYKLHTVWPDDNYLN